MRHISGEEVLGLFLGCLEPFTVGPYRAVPELTLLGSVLMAVIAGRVHAWHGPEMGWLDEEREDR